MKRPLKTIVLVVLCGALVCAAYVGFCTVRGWQLYGAEDQIHGAYTPLVNAIYKYAEERDHPPRELTDLVPDFIEAVPKCDIVQEINYRPHPDGKNWRLELHSNAHGERRIYSWRSKYEYTEEEAKRILGGYHGSWIVMRSD